MSNLNPLENKALSIIDEARQILKQEGLLKENAKGSIDCDFNLKNAGEQKRYGAFLLKTNGKILDNSGTQINPAAKLDLTICDKEGGYVIEIIEGKVHFTCSLKTSVPSEAGIPKMSMVEKCLTDGGKKESGWMTKMLRMMSILDDKEFQPSDLDKMADYIKTVKQKLSTSKIDRKNALIFGKDTLQLSN